MTQFLQNIIDLIFYFVPYELPSREQLDSVKLVAHRGWHDNLNIRENTLKSFDMAHMNNLYGVEFDIRWTKDLVPIIHHDPTLVRLFQSEQSICHMNFKELRYEFPEIPSLSEVVQKYGKKIHLFIELKDEYFPNLIKQKEILNQILSPLRPVEDYHIIGLEAEVFEKFNHFEDRAYLLVASFNMKVLSQTSLEKKWGGITGHYLLLTKNIIKKHKELNQLCGSGFPRSMNPLKREIHRGVDYIFTNHPQILLSNLEKLKNNGNY